MRFKNTTNQSSYYFTILLINYQIKSIIFHGLSVFALSLFLYSNNIIYLTYYHNFIVSFPTTLHYLDEDLLVYIVVMRK